MSRHTIVINGRHITGDSMEGLGRHSYEIVRRLIDHHPEIDWHILYSGRRARHLFQGTPHCTEVTLLPPAKIPILFRMWYDYAVPRYLDKVGADLFWSPDNFLSLRTAVPQLLTIHDLAYRHYPEYIQRRHRRYYERMTPQFIHKAQHILSVSSFTKEDIMDLTGRPAEDITVCYNGSRTGLCALSAPRRLAAINRYGRGHPYAIYLGSMHPRKNIVRLIQAYNTFRENYTEPHRLILAGRRAWHTEEIDKALAEASQRDSIHWIDRFIEEDELIDLLGGAQMLVYPSLFEGFGLPIIEAMQLDIPVITSTTSSMPEAGGDAALYVDPEQVPDIAARIDQLARDPELRNTLILKGRDQAARWSWDKTTDIVWKSMNKIISEKK